MCPYDFLKDFDNWFAWHKYVYFDKLTPEQAKTNIYILANKGWRLINGAKYGAYQFTRTP